MSDRIRPLRHPRFHWLIPDDADTNVPADPDCSRERILLPGATHDHEYVDGSAEVFRFDAAYGLQPGVAGDVSEHYPVFAHFNTTGSRRRSSRCVAPGAATGGTATGGDL